VGLCQWLIALSMGTPFLNFIYLLFIFAFRFQHGRNPSGSAGFKGTAG
jgi:hypothetical protein